METVGLSASLKYECLLFDLDDTLYPMSCGINFACRKNIEEFMLKQLHIDESQVPEMCLELYREHGTTMSGLKALGYEFDDDEFHASVHGTLPYHLLKPDPVLRNILLSLPQRKIIFTNADKAHATQVLSRLGLEDCFEGVICFETLNSGNGNEGGHTGVISSTQILCKPAIESFLAAIVIANIDPAKTIFFDDSVRNIASGKAAGFRTVIVGRSGVVPGADYGLNSIHNIKEAPCEVLESEGEEHRDQLVTQSAVTVTA